MSGVTISLMLVFHSFTNCIKLDRYDDRRLLEKQERVEAIIASLGLPPNFGEGGEEGGGMVGEVDDEKKEQVEAIMETITPPEREQLSTVKALSN